ncbi:cytochrome c biogenesis heme-transporting ATPase CcmA [Legionella waltersii]|uniref:Heme exporter protein CcmA n=1 Tax=Legionella waltersii TaxID=66969 RepID=A0A0W1ANC0_9GAMM|nr:cytochrome c biogenesis heme-transporting ATPase CcmA [Legionella waltersii]KTD82841.1 heme exporter protein CcmA [Legionella waltersii]SNV01708.1 heme exporter protein CcmA [Legionella waltersii]
MLDVIELNFDYQDKPLLRNVSFQLPAGGLLHLRGANGAGKTTLLKLISGLHQPESGKIFFSGQLINERLGEYQKNICWIGHKPGISSYLTLRENCLFDMHYYQSPLNVLELSTVFKLDDYLHTPCSILSAGQKRQVALLRLWMTTAKLWLLDEPFVALDDNSLKILMHKIQEHREQGGAVLVTSHQELPLESVQYEEYYL